MANDSIKQIDLITKFESMSNELLMEIFEYYDLYSLYYSFGLLNSRIENIIYHCEVSVDFDKVKQTDFVDFIREILPKFNAKKIRSLHASNSHQIGVLAYDKSLMYFTHIRSLSLNNIESNIIEYMISCIHFSRLGRVSFDKHENEDFSSKSIFKHFFDSNRFQFLRTYRDSRSVIEKVTSELLFEYVSLSEPCDPCDFLNFLNRSPCLKYIKTELLFRHQYSESIFLLPVPYYNTLIHLNLKLSRDICMKTIIYLFKCVPQICHLKLNIDSFVNPQLADPIFWETFLSKYLLKLKQLSLDSWVRDNIHPIDPFWNSLMDQEKVNEQIKKSNYWSSHQWNATFNSNMPAQQFGYYRARFQVV